MISDCVLIEPFVCNQKDPISKVAEKLKEFRQRHIYVTDDNQKPVGIISTTDILDKIIIAAKNAADFTAEQVMNKGIISCDDEESVKKAYKQMVEKGVVSCCVTQKDKMIGMLTLKEAVKNITDPEKIL